MADFAAGRCDKRALVGIIRPVPALAIAVHGMLHARGLVRGPGDRPGGARRGPPPVRCRAVARLTQHGLRRVLGTSALFSTAYGNVGSSIYYARGLAPSYALGLTPIVFVITGVIFYLTAATYAEATAMYPEAGGSSSFARHAFN